MNRKFIRRLDKNIGFSKLKNQVRSINVMLVFLVVAAAYAVYLNHTGIMLSYGIIVAASAMLILAGFLSYRIRLQVKISGMHLDYRKKIVEPVVQKLYQGTFSSTGGLTEREVLATNLFSDGYEYKYETRNEVKGTYKDVPFETTDVKSSKANSNMVTFGRLFQFRLPTPNINPVVFVNAQAPEIEQMRNLLKTVKTGNEEIDRRYRTYAFDEKEVSGLITGTMEYRLSSIIKMGLGRILKISFANNKVCVYYTTEKPTFEEVLTYQQNTEEEVRKTEKQLSMIDRLLDVLS